MHYLIDGYNLLFRISDYTSKRETIIKVLGKLKINVSVVFDAHNRPGFAYRTHYKYVEILFSGQGESADNLILKLLGKGGPYTVVTSDKGLALEARHLGAKTMSIESFLIFLNKRLNKSVKNKIEPVEENIKKSFKETDFERWLRLFGE